MGGSVEGVARSVDSTSEAVVADDALVGGTTWRQSVGKADSERLEAGVGVGEEGNLEATLVEEANSPVNTQRVVDDVDTVV